jgi:hypothetical protein
MTNGTYGTVKPAQITSNDVDILYFYRPTRSSQSSMSSFEKLDSNVLLTTEVSKNGSTEVLPGMYDLRLPIDKFNKVGVYTIYIKPKEIETTIYDVSTLSAYPNIRGIVLNAAQLDSLGLGANGALVGYRVEYLDVDGTRQDTFRIITSNNRCSPITAQPTNVRSGGQSYRFNDVSNLIFCTLTPSSNMSFDSTSLPYIGEVTQTIRLINTKFNPVMLEVEITEHDIETLTTMIEGEQVRNLDYGLITTFDKFGEIYHQSHYGSVVDGSTGLHHDFKVNRNDNINRNEMNSLQKIKDNLD